MSAVIGAPALVRRYWALFQARRWADAQALLATNAECRWPVTGERFVGAAAIIHVNAAYPEGWMIDLLELNLLADGRVHTLVRVDQGAATFYANSFFTLAAGLIAAVDEYWADAQPPPAWRLNPGQPLPGHERLQTAPRSSLHLPLEPT